MWNFTLERHKSLVHVQRAEADGSESEHSLPVAVDQLWYVLLTHLNPAILLHVVHWDKHTNKTDMNTQIHTVFAQSINFCACCVFIWTFETWQKMKGEREEVTGNNRCQTRHEARCSLTQRPLRFFIVLLWLNSLLFLFFCLPCALVTETCVVCCCQRGCLCWHYYVDCFGGLFHFIIITIIHVFILFKCLLNLMF